MFSAKINKSLNSSFFNYSQSRNSTSMENQNQETQGKLPNIKIKQVLRKIGSVERDKGSFIPNQQDRNHFKKTKLNQLRKQYSTKKANRKVIPYESEDFDQILLDCWTYGERNGRKTVWRKYRQRYDQLTFQTMKLVQKKRLMV